MLSMYPMYGNTTFMPIYGVSEGTDSLYRQMEVLANVKTLRNRVGHINKLKRNGRLILGIFEAFKIRRAY